MNKQTNKQASKQANKNYKNTQGNKVTITTLQKNGIKHKKMC